MISVIIPVFNEQENVTKLYQKIKLSLDRLIKKTPKEIIFIDDGSSDKTLEKLKRLPDIVLIRHQKNRGQTAALLSGFKEAKGDIIVTMDGDLQNDPKEIPLLLKKIDEGYDMVVGWRVKRNDSFAKKLFSKLAYFWRKIIFNSPIHDSGCGLKAIRKETLKEPFPPGEIHRFLPEIFIAQGYKVTEIPVSHSPRKKGKSKYGLKRIFKGVCDSWKIRKWLKNLQPNS